MPTYQYRHLKRILLQVQIVVFCFRLLQGLESRKPKKQSRSPTDGGNSTNYFFTTTDYGISMTRSSLRCQCLVGKRLGEMC